MKKIIISGAAGFIGRHLIEKMISENVEIFAITMNDPNFNTKNFDPTGAVKWILCDLYEQDPYDQLITSGALDSDCFYHLAWNGVNAALKSNYDVQLTNITISTHALTLAKKLNVHKFIILGSPEEYNNQLGLINTNKAPSTKGYYGAFKVAVRYLLTSLAQKYEIQLICAVVASTYGEYRNDDNIISYTIKSLLKKQLPKYGPLTQMWDFLYVKDTVEALYLLGNRENTYKTYAISSGVYRPLSAYICEIRDIIDPSSPLGIGEVISQKDDMASSCLNSFLLQKDTGFLPQYSFNEGIQNTIDYFKKTGL